MLKVTQLITREIRIRTEADWCSGPLVETFAAGKEGREWAGEAALLPGAGQRGTLSFSCEFGEALRCLLSPSFFSSHRLRLQPSKLLAQHKALQGVQKASCVKTAPAGAVNQACFGC